MIREDRARDASSDCDLAIVDETRIVDVAKTILTVSCLLDKARRCDEQMMVSLDE